MNPMNHLKTHGKEHLEQLKDLLRIPSISAQSQHHRDMRHCASWVAEHLNGLGIQTEILESGGHPLVYGEWLKAQGAPTILIYGHYDVQPVDPLNLWDSPPFEPVEKDGFLLARGASDDKGQMFAHIKSVEAFLITTGTLPVNIKFLIEGEEEAEAENLERFIATHQDKLSADIALISDGAQYGPDMPAINIGLRGIALVEVKVTGPDRDLHSGAFGGSVANPVNVLCQLISRLHNENGKIIVDGFYDQVYTPGEWEREVYAKLPFDEEAYRASTGSPGLWGEKGFTALEQTWIRPTLDVNGITGGYQGEGAKTIIPSWASAKITMRLVPDQNPEEINDKLEAYLKKICPHSVRLEVFKFSGANPVQVSTDGPWLKAAARAVKTGFGKEPLFTKEGGSIPVVETFKSVLGIDTLLVGFGQQSDNIHSPNERLLIEDFYRGCRTSVALLEELSQVPAEQRRKRS